jgi:hypothetical protein
MMVILKIPVGADTGGEGPEHPRPRRPRPPRRGPHAEPLPQPPSRVRAVANKEPNVR